MTTRLARPHAVLAAALALCGAVESVRAAATTLELTKPGGILIEADGLAGLEIRPGVFDNSAGKWANVPTKSKFEPATAMEITREAVYNFAGGEAVELKTSVRIEDGDVKAESTWSPAALKGFARMDLVLPMDAARDLTIEVDGTPVSTNLDRKPVFKWAKEVTFRRASDGAFLCKLTGDLNGDTFFDPNNEKLGFTVRLFTVPDVKETWLSENTELRWTLTFRE